MRTIVFSIVLCFNALLSVGQNADTTDWCNVFERIVKTGLLSARESDSINPGICNSKYYIVIDINNIQIEELFCNECNLSFVKIEEMLFCNNTGYNVVSRFSKTNNKIRIFIDVVSCNKHKYRVMFVVRNNGNKEVKARIVK